MENQIEVFEQMMMDYLKGKLKPEDKPRFIMLLNSNEECRKKYHEMSHLYVMTTSSWFAQNKSQNLEQVRKKLGFRSSRKHFNRRNLFIWSSAAIWLLFIVCSVTLWNKESTSNLLSDAPSYCQIDIPAGATSRVLLPDSTVVILNGSSNLKYDARWNERPLREVFLSGEAYFQVKKKTDKPFVVHTDDLNVKVLGTIFNVSSYPDDEAVKVSLVEGRVNVYTASETQNNCILVPNQQAIYEKRQKTLAIQKVNAANQASWTTGKLTFVNENLYNILKSIGRHFNLRIIIQSKKVHKEFFSGTIQLDMTLNEILSYIDVDNKYTWRENGQSIIITDR